MTDNAPVLDTFAKRAMKDIPSTSTRLSLLSRARGQDPEAWQELVSLYGPLVAYWCHRCKLSPHATADCIQDVFLAVSKSLHRYDSRRESGAFRGWLWKITLNCIRDNIRRDKRNALASGGSTAHHRLEQYPDATSIPEDEPSGIDALRDLMKRAMEQVRGEFEHRTWEIFSRAVIDQIPTGIVAVEFGIQPATVRQVRCRVLKRLREQLGDLDLSRPHL